MQLIQHHIFQVTEKALGLLVGEQQRDLFRCGQQDIRRAHLLALAFRLGRVAGAGFDDNRQTHFGNGLGEITLDIDCKRLQR